MVKGRPAIQAFWKGVYDSGVKGAMLKVMDVKSSGDLASEVGAALLRVQAANQPEVTQSVKYVVVWKRQKDGTWKLYRDIWNALPAPKP
jgi:ketosteroid isomerase-like protein